MGGAQQQQQQTPPSPPAFRLSVSPSPVFRHQLKRFIPTSWWLDEGIMHLNFCLLCLLPLASHIMGFRQVSTSKNMQMRPLTKVMKTSTCVQQTNLNEDGEGPSLSKLFNSPILSIGAGVGGMILLLINRLGLDVMMVSDVQSRADIIAVIGCSALLLNVLSEQDISARNRDPVPLVGYALKNPSIAEGTLPSVSSAITWCINTVLQTTPVTSVHIIEGSKVLGRGGVIGSGDDRTSILQNLEKMPILGKTLQLGEEVYLPDLQVRNIVCVCVCVCVVYVYISVCTIFFVL